VSKWVAGGRVGASVYTCTVRDQDEKREKALSSGAQRFHRSASALARYMTAAFNRLVGHFS
jgi:hypothetical protein